jgi:hypothetical protein
MGEPRTGADPQCGQEVERNQRRALGGPRPQGQQSECAGRPEEVRQPPNVEQPGSQLARGRAGKDPFDRHPLPLAIEFDRDSLARRDAGEHLQPKIGIEIVDGDVADAQDSVADS